MMMRSQPPSLTPPVFSPLLRSRARGIPDGLQEQQVRTRTKMPTIPFSFSSLSLTQRTRANSLPLHPISLRVLSACWTSSRAGASPSEARRPRWPRGWCSSRPREGRSRSFPRQSQSRSCIWTRGGTNRSGGTGCGTRSKISALFPKTHTHTHTSSLFKIIGVHRKLQIDSQTSVKMFGRVTH